MHLQPYLFFGGTCSAALDLYTSVFGGSAEVTRFHDGPPEASPPGIDPSGVMHASFTAPGIAFMAADGRPGETYKGGNVSLLFAASVEEGGRIFAALSDGATDVMPLAKQFWGATFGQLTDRYGVDWMFNLG